MTNENEMTEKELRNEAGTLKAKLLREEITPIEAHRLSSLREKLSDIYNIRREIMRK